MARWSAKNRSFGGSKPGVLSPLKLSFLICEVGLMTPPHQAAVSTEERRMSVMHLILDLVRSMCDTDMAR